MLNKCLNTVSICEIGNHRQLYRSLQKKIVGAFNKEKVIVGASFRHCETSRPLTALLPIMEEMTRTEINIPVQSREEGAVATSSCNHEDSGNTPQRRAQMWYLARQLRSQAGGHKI